MTPTELVTRPANNLALTMTAADLAADLAALADYLGRKAPNMRRRMADDLAVFADHLTDAKIPTAPRVADLAAAIAAWPGGTAPPAGAGAYWLGFNLTNTDAHAEFIARYGVPPRELTRARGLLLAEPIPGR